MKFAMFSDLHYDAIPDGNRRLEDLIKYAKEAEVEFIIELGDLCYPLNENKKVLDKLKSIELPCYFTIGNHNTDKFTIDEVMSFFNLKRSYYSFIKGNIKFIVLDSNFIKKKNDIIPYFKRNYDKSKDEYPYIPKEEIAWLKKELEDDEKYYIIISHQSLANDFQRRGISNREEIRSILEERNLNGNKILFCVNGHDHGGNYKLINNIYYYTLNSSSYIWHGTKEVFNYSKETHEQYPYLKDLILYKEALHIIVDIDDDMNVSIEGIDGHYQKHSPYDIGLTSTWNGVSIEAKTPSLYIKMGQ
jgi:hypothetical protein